MSRVIKKFYNFFFIGSLLPIISAYALETSPTSSSAPSSEDRTKKIEEKIALLRTMLKELQAEVQSSIPSPPAMSKKTRKIQSVSKPYKVQRATPISTPSLKNAQSSYLTSVNWEDNYRHSKIDNLNPAIDWKNAYRKFRIEQNASKLKKPQKGGWLWNKTKPEETVNLRKLLYSNAGSHPQTTSQNIFDTASRSSQDFSLSGIPTHVFGKPNSKHPARLALSGKLGNKRHIVQSELFVPISQSDDHMLFTDLRVMRDTKHVQEGNFGVGFRKVIGSTIMGAYMYGDLRKSSNQNQFRQLTVGLEVLTENTDFRMNGYLPKADKFKLPSPETLSGGFRPSGHYFVRPSNMGDNAYELASKGLDIEFGGRIPIESLITRIRHAYFKAYAGGYIFRNDYMPHLVGWRGRAELEVQNMFVYGSVFSVGGEISHDKERGTNSFMHARIAMPLYSVKSCGIPTGIASRLAEPVVRDVDIVSINKGINPDTGKTADPIEQLLNADATPKRFIYVHNNAKQTGEGTYEKPFATVEEAFAKADTDGDIIYITDGTYIQTATLTPIANISVIGSGSPLQATHFDDKEYTLKPATNMSVLKYSDSNINVKNKSLSLKGVYLSNIDHTTSGNAINAVYDTTEDNKAFMLDIKNVITTNKIYGAQIDHTGTSNLKVNNTNVQYLNNSIAAFELTGLSPEKTTLNNSGSDFSYTNGNNAGNPIYGAHITNATVTNTRSTFNKNINEDGKAYGLHAVNCPKITVDNCQFNENRSDNNNAQALVIEGGGGDYKITKSTFSGNFANVVAENVVLALPTGSSNITIKDCIFEQNQSTSSTTVLKADTVSNLTVEKCDFKKSQSGNLSLIVWKASTGKITNCNIFDNDALSTGNLEAIAVEGVSSLEMNSTLMYSNTGTAASSAQIKLKGNSAKTVNLTGGNNISSNQSVMGIWTTGGSPLINLNIYGAGHSGNTTNTNNKISGNTVGIYHQGGSASVKFNGGAAVAVAADIDANQVSDNGTDYQQ